MKTLYLCFILIFALTFFTYSQELYFQFENIESETENTSSKRMKWFYEQRMYPNNFLPEDAYKNSLKQKWEIRKNSEAIRNSIGSWAPLGPVPGTFGGWGFVTGRVNAVKYDFQNPQYIYLAAANGGVWKSLDGGLNWNPMVNEDEIESLSSGALTIDPNNPLTLYYGTGECTSEFQYAYYGRGIYKTTNGGNSWSHHTSGLPDPTYFSRIVVDPENSNILLAACGTNHVNQASETGLYKSTDAGTSWYKVLSGVCTDVIFMPNNSDIVYACGPRDGIEIWELGTSIQYSTNKGETFQILNDHLPRINWGRCHLAVSKNDPDKIILGMATSYFEASIFQIDPQTRELTGCGVIEQPQTGFNFHVYTHPNNSDIVYVGVIDLWKSTDGGCNFINKTNSYESSLFTSSIVHADQHNMDFHPTDPNQIIITNDGGVYKSLNGGETWERLYQGLNITQVYRIASDPFIEGRIFAGTTDNGLQRMQNYSAFWNNIRGGDYGTIVCSKVVPGFIMGTGCSEGSANIEYNFESGDNSWYSPAFVIEGNRTWLAPIIPHPFSEGIFYHGRQKIWKTSSNGSAWLAVSDQLPTSQVIERIDIDFSTNPARIFVTSGSYAFPNQNLQNVYKTTEGSNIWDNITNSLPNRYKTSITVNPYQNNELIVTMSGFSSNNNGENVYKSTNSGTSWFNIATGLPNSPVNSLFIHNDLSSSTKYYIVATDVGVFYSRTDNINWSELGVGLPNNVCMHLDYFASTNKLRVGTFGRGVWEISLNQLNESSEEQRKTQLNVIPLDFRLYQNYPNPFNPTTVLSFDMPKDGYASLKIFNSLGQEVAVIIDGNIKAGSYQKVFNAAELPSGIYFYKFTADGFSDVRKMSLIK